MKKIILSYLILSSLGICLLLSCQSHKIIKNPQSENSTPSNLQSKKIGTSFLKGNIDFKEINTLWLSIENEMKMNMPMDLEVIKWQQKQLDLWSIFKRAESFGIDSQRLITFDCQSFDGLNHLKSWVKDQAQSDQKIPQNQKQKVLYRCEMHLPIKSFEKWQSSWQQITSHPSLKTFSKPLFQEDEQQIKWLNYQDLKIRTQWHTHLQQVSLILFKLDQKFEQDAQTTLSKLEENIQPYLPLILANSSKPLNALSDVKIDLRGMSDLIANLQLQSEDLSQCETQSCLYLSCFESLSYLMQRFKLIDLVFKQNQIKLQFHLQADVVKLWQDSIYPLLGAQQTGLFGMSLSLSPQSLQQHPLKDRLKVQSCPLPAFQMFQVIDRFPLGLTINDFAIPLDLLKLFSINTTNIFDSMGIHLRDLTLLHQELVPNVDLWWLGPKIEQTSTPLAIEGLTKIQLSTGLRWHMIKGIDFYYQMLKNPLDETKSFYQISLIQTPINQFKTLEKDHFLKIWIDFVRLRSKSHLWENLSYRQLLDFLVQHFKQVQLVGSLKQETLQYLLSWER